jgi:hypothetical protein
MPRARKSASRFKPLTPLQRRIGWISATALVATLFVAAAFYYTQRWVDTRLVFPADPPHIVLKDRPAWMSDALAEQIADVARPVGAHGAFDHQLLVDVADVLAADPRTAAWIRRVNSVRRVYGSGPADLIEIDCDYRAPAAIVHWGDYYWLIDADGDRLPEQYGQPQLNRILYDGDGRILLRLIDNIAHPPPTACERWPGDDVAAALGLVKYLAAQPCAADVLKVDADNFGGRRDRQGAQLVLVTRDGGRISWGRPAGDKDDFDEVSPARKMARMQQIIDKYGRLDAGHAQLDLRFDEVTFAADPQH